MKTILITGARGFIGFNAVQRWHQQNPSLRMICIDANTYADRFLQSKKEEWENSVNIGAEVKWDAIRHYTLDLAHKDASQHIERWCKGFGVDTIIDFHAESHVDNSISNPGIFFESNVIGTTNLLEVARRLGIRFHYVSTDEVVGPIAPEEATDRRKNATEDAIYNPSSPYSASKASAELAVKCYAKTFGLKATISRCTNNFGPWQHTEKLIPLSIKRLLAGEKIPIYGDGLQRRFWIHVDQHIDAIKAIVKNGIPDGRIYHIVPNANNLKTNIKLVECICKMLNLNFESHIEHVADRLAHDVCYWLESNRMLEETGWHETGNFEVDLEKTVRWYREVL